MTVSHQGSLGSPAGSAQGSTSISVPYPSGVLAGRIAILEASVKLSTAIFGEVENFTLITSHPGGTGGSANDAGTTRVGVWYRILDGSETGSVTVTNDAGVSSAGAMSIYGNTLGGWATPIAVVGSDDSHGADWSASLSSWAASLAAGDRLVIVNSTDTDAVQSITAPTITQTDATFGTITQRNALRSTTDTDCACYSWDVSVTTGSANAPTWTHTSATSACGATVIVRLREVTPAAPTVVEVVSAESSGITATVITGAGTVIDDILLIIATDNYYTSYNAPSQPSGVTTLTHIGTADNDVSGNRPKINAWWGKVTSDGAKTINVDPTSDEQIYLAVYVLRGANLTNPVDVFNTASDTSSATTLAIPVVTTTVADTRIITAGNIQANVNMSSPSPWAEDAEPGNAFGRMNVSSYAKATIGATTADNWTLSSSSFGPSLTIAIKPAVSGFGTGDFSLVLAVESTGSAPSGGSGTGAFSIDLALAGTGATTKSGVAALNIELALDSTGDAPAVLTAGVAAFTLDVAVFAYGASVSRITPVRILTQQEILTGNRNTKFYLDVLDSDDAPQARLDGVTDGKLDWVANAVVKGAGELTVIDVDQGINWLTVHLRPVMLIEGLPAQPLGVFLVSEAPENWGNGRSWSIKMLDKSTILDQDTVLETYALDTGTIVTTAIRSLIESAGITNHAITSSTATIPAPLVWNAGTSKLRIINDLLALINYFSLFSNFNGQMVGNPYILPAKRPLSYEFIDGSQSIYESRFNRDNDIWSIPNRVTVVGVGSGTTAALTSTKDNNDVSSPYSIVNRGRVIGHTETGVEAATQAILDAYAQRRLVELTSPTASVEISHSPVPGLAINQAARFRRQPAGIDARHVVSKTSITLKGNALATSTLREVVDL